jgi:cardiolipin synthase A/B
VSVTTAVIIAVAASILGSLLFFAFSHRRRTPELKLDPDVLPPIETALPLLAGLTESAVFAGNRAEVLQNGALFPRMLADIAAARHTIHFETFIWHAGELAAQFVAALTERATAGVRVRLLIDAIGSAKADGGHLEQLEASGVQVRRYGPMRIWNWRRYHQRTHRKLMVVDGAVGYTFGHGIADEWLGEGEDPGHWRDTGLRVEGPVVHGLQSVFAQNWVEETRELPAGPGCFAALEPCGSALGHVVSSASGDAVSSVALLYSVAIACARREVLIQNPYFAPDDGVVQLLVRMVRRGVAVHLMLPGKHTDSPFVRRAGCHLYAALLRGGVRLYEFQPALLHQKVVVVDGLWAHVGSTNFDARSLALNEEVGIGVLDATVAADLRAAFASDLKRSRELTLEEWTRRPAYARAFDRLAYLVHDQL